MKRTRQLVWAVLVFAAGVALFLLATSPAGDDNLSRAAATGDLPTVERLLDDGHPPDEPLVLGFSPLMRAAIRDDLAIVNALVSAGADIHASYTEGLQPIHVAARANSVASVDHLLDLRADPSIRSTNGMNALDHAVEAGAVEVLVLLAKTGLDINASSGVVAQGHGYPRDRGASPLAIAARAGQVSSVRALLQLGAEVDTRSANGHTALYAAVFAGNSADIVELLLAAGADPKILVACDEGCTDPPGSAFEWASRLGHDHLVQILG